MNERTHWKLPADARYLGPHDPHASLAVTVVLRRKGKSPSAAAWPQPPSWQRETYAAHYGADPADVESLRGFAREHGLQETACHVSHRTLHLQGSVQALQRAFGVELGHYQRADGSQFTASAQAPSLPTALSPAVMAVLGLDLRPIARAQFRKPQAQPSTSYTPPQLGQLYQFPANTDGSGQTIALIELGGGYSSADLQHYFSGLGIATPSLSAVSVDGGKSQPGGQADGEVMLDIEVAGALAAGAKLVVYFAPNTDQGFYNAISHAAHDTTYKPSIISISWGGPESNWSTQSLAAMQAALQDAAAVGVTVIVAAGDDGSSDGVSGGQPHVDFPSSSPYALACGGTRLKASNGHIQSEVVWNETAANEGASGGGVSVDFPLPAFQAKVNVPTATNGYAGRGVPDVAGNADPLTGYQVRVDGKDQVIGGTSAVAPLWAALIARLNQQLGSALGDPHAAFYQIGSAPFRDITQGNNGSYQAAVGWDPCTGLGSPNGQALLNALIALKGNAKCEAQLPLLRQHRTTMRPCRQRPLRWGQIFQAGSTQRTPTASWQQSADSCRRLMASPSAGRSTLGWTAAPLQQPNARTQARAPAPPT
ncbi:S53 family peptidase [Dyella silvatica]|uniref:S53 family peptidase n=1 Tax=Dyella silvatica TaxID=2992128 RepID=UPI00225BDC74|nr:S53 family peptidase [Dyella silvatica]